MRLSLNSEAKILILISAIHAVVGVFFGTFLISYIMQISDNEAVSISIYNIALFTALTAGFLLLADTVKRKNKMRVYRMNLFIQAASLITIATVGENIAPFIAVFGAVQGFASAFLHTPLNVIISEKVKKRMMVAYSGYNAMVGGIVSIATPLILGFLITIGSYEYIAVFMLLFLCAAYVLSFFLHSHNPAAKRFSISNFIPLARRSILVRRVMFVEFLAGLSVHGPLGVVSTMFVVFLFHTDFFLGLITSAFAVVSIIISFLVGRFGRPEKFPALLVISNSLTIFAGLIFLLFTGKWSFLFYRLIQSSAMHFIMKVKHINMFNTSNSAACVAHDCRTEFLVVRETILNAGRILSFLILFTIGYSGNIEWLKYYLVFLTLVFAVAGAMSLKICRGQSKSALTIKPRRVSG